jgi:hypothetical protein
MVGMMLFSGGRSTMKDGRRLCHVPLEKVEEILGHVGFSYSLLTFQHDDLEMAAFAAFILFDQEIEQWSAAAQKSSVQKRLQRGRFRANVSVRKLAHTAVPTCPAMKRQFIKNILALHFNLCSV